MDAPNYINEVSDDDELTTWINWYTSLRGNELFCRVDESFIQDSFNLTGLNSNFAHYEQALMIILDMDSDEEDDEQNDDTLHDRIEAEAETLYGLIHQRFILTPRGLYMMYQKYANGDFGTCPRVGCHGQYVVPAGVIDSLHVMAVRFYCPGCNEMYVPIPRRFESIDGAYFGTTFPHLFFLTYPDLLLNAKKNSTPYVPRVFGFRINKNAHAVSLEATKREERLAIKEKKEQQETENNTKPQASDEPPQEVI